MPAGDACTMFEPLPAPTASSESTTAQERYADVALGVECAWPLAAYPGLGLATEAPDLPSSSPSP